MEYKIIIPSFQRSAILLKKTLALLIKHNINPKIVYIFVGNEAEYQIYKNVLPEDYKERLIIGVVGMKNIRNYITNYFEEDECLFYIDDDVVDFYKLKDNSLEPIDKLDNLIKECFYYVKANDGNLFSFYPVKNAFFMKNKIRHGLIYCMGGSYGILNNKKELLVSVDNKEDFERSIQYYINNKNNIRFDDICIGTKGYCGKGGMNAFNRDNEVLLEACSVLLEKYPLYCELNLKKANDKPELKLKRKVY
jgi:hypothetical protein